MPAQKFNTVLFEKQNDINTPSDLLVASDYLDVMEAAKFDIDPEYEPDARGAGAFEQYSGTVGQYNNDISLLFGLYSLGSGVTPDLVRVAECAGWTKVEHADFIRLTPTSEIVNAGTLWGYRGGPGTNKAVLEKHGNIMFDWEIALEAAKRATMRFTGKGRYVAEPVLATLPDVDAYRERLSVPAMRGGSISLLGSSRYATKFISANFKANQSIENHPDATATFGGGDSEILDRAIDGTIVVRMEAHSNTIPHDSIQNGTELTVDFQWGTIYNQYDVRLLTSRFRVTNVKEGNVNGATTWEISGQVLRNSLELRIYNAAASSSSLSSSSGSSQSSSSLSTSASSESSSSTLA